MYNPCHVFGYVKSVLSDPVVASICPAPHVPNYDKDYKKSIFQCLLPCLFS